MHQPQSEVSSLWCMKKPQVLARVVEMCPIGQLSATCPGCSACVILRLGCLNRRRAAVAFEGLVDDRCSVLVRRRTRTPQGKRPNIRLEMTDARALQIPTQWTS